VYGFLLLFWRCYGIDNSHDDHDFNYYLVIHYALALLYSNKIHLIAFPLYAQLFWHWHFVSPPVMIFKWFSGSVAQCFTEILGWVQCGCNYYEFYEYAEYAGN